MDSLHEVSVSKKGCNDENPRSVGVPHHERACCTTTHRTTLAIRARSGLNERVSDVVSVHVKPGSKKGPLVETGPDGELTVYVRERAVDGKANAAVIRVLAEHFGVPRSRVELTGGASSRIKRFRIG